MLCTFDFGGKRNADGKGFAAFGRVVKGMEIVRKIPAAPADGQTLTPPIKILREFFPTFERSGSTTLPSRDGSLVFWIKQSPPF